MNEYLTFLQQFRHTQVPFPSCLLDLVTSSVTWLFTASSTIWYTDNPSATPASGPANVGSPAVTVSAAKPADSASAAPNNTKCFLLRAYLLIFHPVLISNPLRLQPFRRNILLTRKQLLLILLFSRTLPSLGPGFHHGHQWWLLFVCNTLICTNLSFLYGYQTNF